MTKKQEKKHLKFFQKIPSLIVGLYNKGKFLLRLFIITIIAGIIGLAIILANTNPNMFKEDISASIERATGKTVKIDGDLEWELFSFEPAIKIEKLAIENEKWGKNKNIITAENIIATISLRHLLSRKISINTLIFDTPKIFLEVSSTGKKNWQLSTSSTKPQKKKKDKKNAGKDTIPENLNLTIKKKKEFEIDVKTVEIHNAKINYENRRTHENNTFNLKEFFITSENHESPILFTVDTSYNDIKLKGNFKTTSLHDLIENINSIPLTGIININDMDIKFSGKLNDIRKKTPSISATIFITANDIQSSLKGITELPKLAPINADFEIIATDSFISLKKINIDYLTANISGTSEISLTKNKKPNIKANLHIPFFDIPNIFYPNWEKAYFNRLATGAPRPRSNAPKVKNPKAFRNIPLPITELNLANLNINLSIAKLKAMPEMDVNDIKIKAILNNGNGIIAPISFDYMGGKVKIEGLANNQNNTFNGQLSIKANNVNLGKIIDSTGYKKVFEGGNTDVDIILSGYGPNLAVFMTHLNGYIKAYTTTNIIGYKIENTLMATDLVTSIFKFIGNDIIGTIALQDKKLEKSNIQCMVVNLNVKNGKTISNRGIAMQTKTANIIIDGSANLGKEYVDVSIVTVVKEGFKLSGNFAEMIKIEGPMAEPSIIISKDGVISTVAKTAFTTAIASALTGGISLITTGIGFLTKSWLDNIQSDTNPCLTAFEGKADGQPTDEFSKQYQIKNDMNREIESQKQNLNSITTKAIESEKKKVKSSN